jgi:hypothetical protein
MIYVINSNIPEKEKAFREGINKGKIEIFYFSYSYLTTNNTLYKTIIGRMW